MISDEIEQLRHAGSTDAEIASLVTRSTGVKLRGDTIARYYGPPEVRAAASAPDPKPSKPLP